MLNVFMRLLVSVSLIATGFFAMKWVSNNLAAQVENRLTSTMESITK